MSRNRKPLTLGEKLRVIEEAEKRTGSTKASIARDLNIPESSLKTILAKKDSILLNASKFGLNRKAAKDGKYAAMEKALRQALPYRLTRTCWITSTTFGGLRAHTTRSATCCKMSQLSKGN
ncbi:hypothetical protein MRX96_040966 [Rhipicephalus microplus]